MGLWPRRQAEKRTLTFSGWPVVPVDPAVAPASALANPDVYSCTRVLADAAASCPLIVYRRLPSGERRRASNRTAELLRSPAEDTTQANFVSTLMSHLLLWGTPTSASTAIRTAGWSRLHHAVVERKLTVPDDEELRAQVANTIAKHNRRGWRLDKPLLAQPNDSVIALCMALDALENQPEPVELVGWL